MPENKPKISCEALKQRKMKRTREGNLQTDEDVFEDDSHSCPKCKSTNARLAEIDEKPERLLKLTHEFETYKSRVKSLEDKQKSMQESLGSSQTQIKEMQGLQDNIAEQQKTIEASLQHTSIDSDYDKELEEPSLKSFAEALRITDQLWHFAQFNGYQDLPIAEGKANDVILSLQLRSPKW